MKTRIDNVLLNDAMNKLNQYLGSTVQSGTSVADVLFSAQRANTALQILSGNLDVIESKIMLEYRNEKPE